MMNTYQYTDEEINRLFKSDKERCIEIVYRKYWKLLYSYAFSIVKDAHATEDILQDTFLNLWKTKATISINSSLYPYLLSCTKYASIKYLKKKVNTVDFAQKVTELENNAKEETELCIDSDNQQQTNIVKTSAEKMPPRMKEVFLLRISDELSYKQIAKRLGIAESTVKKQLYYAMKFLHKNYK